MLMTQLLLQGMLLRLVPLLLLQLPVPTKLMLLPPVLRPVLHL
jgi:hypothetical protein